MHCSLETQQCITSEDDKVELLPGGAEPFA